MDEEGKTNSSPILKSKKPGPRPTRCMWCGSTECTHCRCTGQTGCNHKKGEMCPNQRYKRRLVCNSCEKNKLREKQQMSISSSSKRKRGKVVVKVSKKKESVKVSPKVIEPLNPISNIESSTSPVMIQNTNIQLLNVFLTNRNSTVGSLYVQGSNTRLSVIRPNILQIISQLEENVNFIFLQQGRPIQIEQENSINLSDVIHIMNNMPQIDITLINHMVHPIYSSYSELSNDVPNRFLSDPSSLRNSSLLVPLPVQQRSSPPPSLSSLSSHPSTILSPNPSSSLLPPPPPSTTPPTTTTLSPTHPNLLPPAQPSLLPPAQPSLLPQSQPSLLPQSQPSLLPQSQPSLLPQSQPSLLPQSQPSLLPQSQSQSSLLLPTTNSDTFSHDGIWNSVNDTPLQKLLREATTSGRVDAILNQASLNPNDFVFDDRPRELHSRGSSYTHVGSIDNFYSRPNSMIFPPNSIPGSMTFNYFGSNTSMDNLSGYDDIVNKLRSMQDDDLDKGAPSL